jgi:hypothetical protein
MILARTVFCLSITATLFWVFGFAAERIAGAEPPFWSYAAPALLVAAICAFGIFRAWPTFLTLKSGATARYLRSFVVWTLLAYVAGAALVGGIAYLLLNPAAQPSEGLSAEASLAAYILALWFPLWFAPALGLALGWWRQATRAL